MKSSAAHLSQATQNRQFHDALCTSYPDHYYDWKVTVCFYEALHYLDSYCCEKGETSLNTHRKREIQLNPRNQSEGLKLSNGAWNLYSFLLEESKKARYDGFIDYDHFMQMKKDDHSNCVIALEKLKEYFKSKGVALD